MCWWNVAIWRGDGCGRRRGELGGGELGVALGGGEALVAEQFLDGAEVGAFFQQMGAEGVAQCVRVHVGGRPRRMAMRLTMRPTLRVVRRAWPPARGRAAAD